jgi:hypothetical protein
MDQYRLTLDYAPAPAKRHTRPWAYWVASGFCLLLLFPRHFFAASFMSIDLVDVWFGTLAAATALAAIRLGRRPMR